LLGVDLAVDERATTDSRHARGLRGACILREVVGCDEGSSYAFVQARPAMVGCVNDGILETTWILEIEVELAVLRAVGGGCAGADVGLELVKAVRYDLAGVSELSDSR